MEAQVHIGKQGSGLGGQAGLTWHALGMCPGEGTRWSSAIMWWV